MSVDISGVDKVVLLRELWNNSKPAAFFTMNGIPPPPFNETNAKFFVDKYIDYYDGRLIKTDISGDTANPSMYDRDNGSGSFQKSVDAAKNTTG